MTQFKDNLAAWLPYEKATELVVGPGPIPNPAENEVVIKVVYAAINPVDIGMQDAPYFQPPYPHLMGSDVSGTVAALGSGITRFKIGQRVLGMTDSILTGKQTNAGFQNYSTCLEIFMSEVPDHVPLANAAVLPLSIGYAATALFKHLELPLPTLEPERDERTILVWGGSSSAGSTAIQMAVSAGLTVATTVSAHNFDYARNLGATHIFDHNSLSVVEDILKVLKKGDVVFDSISHEDTQKTCAKILSKIGGGKFPVGQLPKPTEYENVQAIFTNGGDPGLVNLDIGDAIFRKYIPQALAAGKFVPKPEPLIIEGGLEKVQEGINVLRKGVSARKVVIEICKG